MTPRDAFKVAVLGRLADHGVGPLELPGLVAAAITRQTGVKVAAADFGKAAVLGLETLARFVESAGPIAAAGLVAAPVAGGAAAGHLLAKAREDDTELDAAKADETIAAYRQLAADAARRARAKGLPLPRGVHA